MAALLVAGCAAKNPPPPPKPAPPPLSEAPLPPSGAPTFEIGEINPRKSDDGKALFVEGSVRNIGTRASRDVKVFVEGLDVHDLVIARAETLPTPQAIEPGTEGRFVVRLPNDPAIRTFHVEALGR